MRRVREFFSWQARVWEGQVGLLSDLSPAQEEGNKAYALRQATLQVRMEENCVKLWQDIPKFLELWRPYDPNYPVGSKHAPT